MKRAFTPTSRSRDSRARAWSGGTNSSFSAKTPKTAASRPDGSTELDDYYKVANYHVSPNGTRTVEIAS